MVMKRWWLLGAIFSIFLSGCQILPEKAGIEIMSDPTAKVFIDGKEAGQTPYKNNSLKPGEIEIKLVTDNDGSWTKTIRLQNGTNTVVSREMNADPSKNSGFLLSLEPTGDDKKAGLLVHSQPDRAAVLIDDEVKGTSPMRLEDIGEGDKHIKVSFPTYKDQNIFAKGIVGYQLLIDADLATDYSANNTADTVASPSATPENTGPMVKIKETETGWLRVRKDANGSAEEIAKVNPGEKYKFVNEMNGYTEIELNIGMSGWVSSKYVDKISESGQ